MFGLKNKDIEKAEDRVHEYQKWLHIVSHYQAPYRTTTKLANKEPELERLPIFVMLDHVHIRLAVVPWHHRYTCLCR